MASNLRPLFFSFSLMHSDWGLFKQPVYHKDIKSQKFVFVPFNVQWINTLYENFFLTFETYQMDSSVHLVQELDGVRIIGNEAHELLQRVPGQLYELFCLTIQCYKGPPFVEKRQCSLKSTEKLYKFKCSFGEFFQGTYNKQGIKQFQNLVCFFLEEIFHLKYFMCKQEYCVLIGKILLSCL